MPPKLNNHCNVQHLVEKENRKSLKFYDDDLSKTKTYEKLCVSVFIYVILTFFQSL